MKTNEDTMLVQLTVGELVELLKEEFPILSQKETKSEEKVALPGEGPTFAGRLVYGIHGIRGLFGVSHKTAHEWKKTWLQPAVKQYGRKIIVDADYALKLFGQMESEKAKTGK